MSKLPPVPPDQRSPGPSTDAPDDQAAKTPNLHDKNLHEQDRQGNTAQNTTNKGYQQDR